MRPAYLSAGLLVAATALPVGTLAAQSALTLEESARWLASTGTELAVSSSDETATMNLRRVSYTASATLALAECRLTIVVTDNSGVSGTRTTMEVPLAEIAVDSVHPVSRPEGYHDFISIPGQYFVTIPAREPDAYPFLTATSRGERRSYLATIPARDREAAALIGGAVRRAALLCGAPTPP